MDDRFAKRLKSLREEKGYSVFQLAKKARISPSELAELEQAKRTPQATTVAKLSEALGVSRSVLISELENRK